jgi:hypothetical protein
VVAENRLSFDILRPKLQKLLSRPLPEELGTLRRPHKTLSGAVSSLSVASVSCLSPSHA